MDTSESDDTESYHEKLVRIFAACDLGVKGYLTLPEFDHLCMQLHLHHQKDHLYQELGLQTGIKEAQVYFKDFEQALLALLQTVGAESLTSGGKHHSHNTDAANGSDLPEERTSSSYSAHLLDYNDDPHYLSFNVHAIDSDLMVSADKHMKRSLPSVPNWTLCERTHEDKFLAYVYFTGRSAIYLRCHFILEFDLTSAELQTTPEQNNPQAKDQFNGPHAYLLTFTETLDYTSGNEEELAQLVEKLDRTATAFGIEISAEIKLMINNTSGIGNDIMIGDQKLEIVGEDSCSNGKQPKLSLSQIETFENEDVLSEPADLHHGLAANVQHDQLLQICSQLEVGHNGYLTQTEFDHICHFLGLEQLDSEGVKELFTRLDLDQDGYITVDELLHYFSHHSIIDSSLQISTKVSHERSLSTRKIRTPVPPALLHRSSISAYSNCDTVCLFSVLKSSFTGYAKGEDIVDYWESLSVPHGADILGRLGFESHTIINLKELSIALTSEWLEHLNDEDSLASIFTATLQSELNYLRTLLDQTIEERDKLRADVNEALTCNAMLATEVDERHAQLHKSFETKIHAQEQLHQEQLRNLQMQNEKVRESLLTKTSSLSQVSEEILNLHYQITTLQDKLSTAETQIEELKKELALATEKQAEWEFQYQQLKKEFQHHQEQFLGRDSPTVLVWEQEKQIAKDISEHYAAENKALKDQNDELLVELEELQQCLASKQRKVSSGSQDHSTISQMPLYARALSVSSGMSEMDDDDLLSSTESFYNHLNALTSLEQESKPSLGKELQQRQNARMSRVEMQERERKEIEHACRVEIAELEDRHQTEKEQILQNFEKAKLRQLEDFQGQLAQKLAEQQKELQNAFAMEKHDLLQQYESRKNYMQIQHEQEKQSLTQRIRKEIQDQLTTDRTQAECSKQHNTETRKLEQEKSDLELKVAELLEKLSHCDMEMQDQRKKFEDEITKAQNSLKDNVETELRKDFKQGIFAQEEKFKDDFLCMIQQHQELIKHQHADQTLCSENGLETNKTDADLERDHSLPINQYETQITALQQELAMLKQEFQAQQIALECYQSGEMAHSIRQEMLVEKIAQGLKEKLASSQQMEQEMKNDEQLYGKFSGSEKQSVDKFTQTSSDMEDGQMSLAHEDESLGRKADNMVDLETFCSLQASLLEYQHHTASLQEAFIERTHLDEMIMAEVEEEHRIAHNTRELERQEMQLQLDTTLDLYQSLASQHKQLHESSIKLAEMVKDLYIQNVDLMLELQQTEAKQQASQRQYRKLQLKIQNLPQRCTSNV